MSSTYDQVSDSTSNRAGLMALKDFFAKAAAQTAKLMVIGDSTLSAYPNANCVMYSQMVSAFGSIYQNVPALTHLDSFTQNHGANPFGIRSIYDNTGGVAAPYDSDASHYGTAPITYLPPGCRPAGYRSDTSLGIFHSMLASNIQGDADATNRYTRLLFRPNASWGIQDALGIKIHAVQGTSSGEMQYKVIASDGVGAWALGVSDFGSPIISGTTSLTLEGSGNLIKTLDLGSITLGANATNVAVKLDGSDATKYTNVLGATFYNATNTAGVHIIPFSVSGSSTAYWANNAPNCDVNLDAFGTPDAVWIQYGLNDASASISAATFKTQLQAIAARLRAKFPACLIIYVAPYYRTGLSGGQQTEYDQYPGALAEIVAADTGPSVAVNLRNIAYRIGFNATTYASWTTDGLHPNPIGAKIMANVAVNTLRRSADSAVNGRVRRPGVRTY